MSLTSIWTGPWRRFLLLLQNILSRRASISPALLSLLVTSPMRRSKFVLSTACLHYLFELPTISSCRSALMLANKCLNIFAITRFITLVQLELLKATPVVPLVRPQPVEWTVMLISSKVMVVAWSCLPKAIVPKMWVLLIFSICCIIFSIFHHTGSSC